VSVGGERERLSIIGSSGEGRAPPPSTQ
jgi:hypothetical protein